MTCTVPSLAHPDGLYPFLYRVSFPHNKTPKVFCPTFGVHYKSDTLFHFSVKEH